jgi:hypothetical protein
VVTAFVNKVKIVPTVLSTVPVLQFPCPSVEMAFARLGMVKTTSIVHMTVGAMLVLRIIAESTRLAMTDAIKAVFHAQHSRQGLLKHAVATVFALQASQTKRATLTVQHESESIA